jgi:NAD(P)-dependent dehydrogenase (short-subunit alcohol dehydrogenase family)
MAAHVAVVTGGTGGLGETMSTGLHDKGYTVVVTYFAGNRLSPICSLNTNRRATTFTRTKWMWPTLTPARPAVR